jgi:hypothetical protein
MGVVWAVAGFGLAFLLTRDRRTSLVIGLLVLSHWVLDFVSHPMGMGKELPPDLPLLFEVSPKVGLGLYNSVVAALITDFGLLTVGSAIYLSTTTPRDRTGTRAFWLMMLSLFVLAALAAVPQLALLATLSMALLWPIGNWVDRHREVRTAQVQQAA